MKISLYTDGGARGNPGPAAAGIQILFGNSELRFGYYLGTKTNNQAEYMALILGLKEVAKLARSMDIEKIQVYLDSELIVKQLRGEYRVKDDGLRQLYSKVAKLISALPVIEFTHIPREKNRTADEIVNIVLDAQNGIEGVV